MRTLYDSECATYKKHYIAYVREVTNILVLYFHVYWYYVPMSIGTMFPCLLVLCSHVYWYSVLMSIGTVFPCLLVLCSHVYWYCVPTSIGTVFPCLLVLCSDLHGYDYLVMSHDPYTPPSRTSPRNSHHHQPRTSYGLCPLQGTTR